MTVYKIYIKIHPKTKAQVIGVSPSLDGANRHAHYARMRTYAPALVLECEWEQLNNHERELFNIGFFDILTTEFNFGPNKSA